MIKTKDFRNSNNHLKTKLKVPLKNLKLKLEPKIIFEIKKWTTLISTLVASMLIKIFVLMLRL